VIVLVHSHDGRVLRGLDSLCVDADQYPTLFPSPLYSEYLHIAWYLSFEQICADLSVHLGDNACGFEWTQLTVDDGCPCWYWRLGPHLTPQIVMFIHGDKLDFKILNSKGDPDNALRNAIMELIRLAEVRAVQGDDSRDQVQGAKA
jgi:hypothetical protein